VLLKCIKKYKVCRKVAQFGRVLALGARCRRFKSCLSDQLFIFFEIYGGVLVSTVLPKYKEARMSWSNGIIKKSTKKLNGEDNIAGLLDEAAAIMNNADAVLARFSNEVVA
jgi:hypothetical protein